jgi:type IV pilus assembly protein PilE
LRSQRGLTLVELMVVVAVLAILSGIAYPLYTTQAQKARRADAKIALEKLAMDQERFYTINGRYSNDYAELYTGTLARAAGFDWPCLDGDTCVLQRGTYSVDIGFDTTQPTPNQTFTATANRLLTGSQASDDDCAAFRIIHTGEKSATDGGGTNCW